MAYNYEYPYVDPNRYNDDWALHVIKNIDDFQTTFDARMTALENTVASYMSETNANIVTLRTSIATTKTECNDYAKSLHQDVKVWTTDKITETVTELKTYTDNKITALKGELLPLIEGNTAAIEALETALDDLKSYVDTQDAATLSSSKAYTDEKIMGEATIRYNADAALETSLKSYTDTKVAEQKTYIDTQDTDVKNACMARADSLYNIEKENRIAADNAIRTDFAAADATTLQAAKDYADDKIVDYKTYVDQQDTAYFNAAKAYSNDNLAAAKSYASAKDDEVTEATDTKILNTKEWVNNNFGQITQLKDVNFAESPANDGMALVYNHTTRTFIPGEAEVVIGSITNIGDVNFNKIVENDGKVLCYDFSSDKFIAGSATGGDVTKNYVDTGDQSVLEASKNYASTVAGSAESNAKAYAADQATAAETAAKSYADSKASAAETNAVATAKSYTDTQDNNLKDYADTQDANVLSDAQAYANDVLEDAKDYTDAQVESVNSLSKLNDVSISTPTTAGQILKYDGSKWINSTATPGGATKLVDLEDYNTEFKLTHLKDVDPTDIKDNSVFIYSAADEKSRPIEYKLEKLKDTDISSPAGGQVLTYESGKWTNKMFKSIHFKEVEFTMAGGMTYKIVYALGGGFAILNQRRFEIPYHHTTSTSPAAYVFSDTGTASIEVDGDWTGIDIGEGTNPIQVVADIEAQDFGKFYDIMYNAFTNKVGITSTSYNAATNKTTINFSVYLEYYHYVTSFPSHSSSCWFYTAGNNFLFLG